MDDQAHKPHRASKKSKEKKKIKDGPGSNPKAFTFSNPGKLARQAARSHEIKEKRLHVPLVDRIPHVPPPKLVALVGPPGVGKTTLLRSLIRRYSKETISSPVGPVTVVTSKKQRLTFLECPNELEAMVDVAKVADIVLLMIDGNFGFEMETLEFLNILAATGMPGNMFGILTHLDLFRKPSTLKDAKKRLKHRLWAELYHGAKLFYLSGVLNGRYPDREVHNLSRFLSVMKNARPLVWRNTHPYLVVDQYRDITHPELIHQDEKCDRSIELSGYIRGTNFAADGQRIHVAGLGDFTVAKTEALPDPCPTPAMQLIESKATGKKGRRRLDEKDKKVYAPFSDRSGLKITGDHIVITRENGFNFDKDAEDLERGEGERLIIDLQGERRLLGQTDQGVSLFAGGQQITSTAGDEDDNGRKAQRRPRTSAHHDLEDDDMPEAGSSGSEDGDGSDVETEFNEKKLGKLFRGHLDSNVIDGEEAAFADSDSDLGSIESGNEDEDHDEGFDGSEDEFDSGDEVDVKWKEKMLERAKSWHGKHTPYRATDLARLMYSHEIPIKDVLSRWRGQEAEKDDEEEENIEDDENENDGVSFFKKSKGSDDVDTAEDRFIPVFDYEELGRKWGDPESIEALRTKFATANLLDENGAGDSDDMEAEDDIGDGAFEDLEEAGEAESTAEPEEDAGPEKTIEEERDLNAKRKEELKLRFEEEDREGLLNDRANARRDAGQDDEFGEDQWYDLQKAKMQKQLDINQEAYADLDEGQRRSVEGHRAGKYCKIVIDGVPSEFVKAFQPRIPIVVGGLLPTEDRFGFVQVRIKRHRWHKKVLKNGDPLIFSLGWRRFQSLPIFSTSDSRTRNRMLKYTPEHMHCFATFFGPLIAPNTGFVAFQNFSSSNPGFRIAATGTVLGVDESTDIVKKLKLTGAPAKIYKNTAFIKDMFSSALEVAKFEGASIRTVSGVRGQIKRALSKPAGQFRATFEDKILASDIVFLRAWYPVKPHRFYNPVTNLLAGGWQPMRLTGEVRRDGGLPTPLEKNSQYRKIERATRHFNPLQVPRALAAALPFRSQVVRTRPQRHPTYLQQRRAVIVTGHEERRARDLMQKLTTIRNETAEKRRQKKEEKRKEHRKMVAEREERRADREKKETRDYWEREGHKRTASNGPGGGRAGKKRRK